MNNILIIVYIRIFNTLTKKQNQKPKRKEKNIISIFKYLPKTWVSIFFHNLRFSAFGFLASFKDRFLKKMLLKRAETRRPFKEWEENSPLSLLRAAPCCSSWPALFLYAFIMEKSTETKNLSVLEISVKVHKTCQLQVRGAGAR